MGPGPGYELLEWWEAERRDLPWRGTRDPWAVLVSELMLQQTQVARVEPRWHRFLERFPTPAACASAGAGAVVEEWAGLGYNRRAVNLHRCAVAVVDDHGGRFPDDLADLLALPGIGPYTARAVLAFAFEHDVAVVDTNVGRILARTAGRSLGAKEAQALADSLVPEGEGWAWNQAMLDLGATVCAKRSPACERCPVATGCAWALAGRPEPDPATGSHAVESGPEPLRGVVPPGPVAAARRAPPGRSGAAVAVAGGLRVGRPGRLGGRLRAGRRHPGGRRPGRPRR